MIDWGNLGDQPKQKKPRERKKRMAPAVNTSPYLVRQWEAMPQFSSKNRKSHKRKRRENNDKMKLLKQLRSPSYLWEVPFEIDKHGRQCLSQSLLDKQNPCHAHYKAYSALYGFAYNSAGIWSCRFKGSKFLFYGVAFDFYKVKDHLLHVALPERKAPMKIQKYYDSHGRIDEYCWHGSF